MYQMIRWCLIKRIVKQMTGLRLEEERLEAEGLANLVFLIHVDSVFARSLPLLLSSS
jgi:hypothetical protein